MNAHGKQYATKSGGFMSNFEGKRHSTASSPKDNGSKGIMTPAFGLTDIESVVSKQSSEHSPAHIYLNASSEWLEQEKVQRTSVLRQ